MGRPAGSADVIEYRRQRALALLDEGRSLHETGRLLNCSPSSVMRWRDARDRFGAEGLRVQYSPGRPPKLTDKQRVRLERILLAGAGAAGFATDLWTTPRIRDVIRKIFGVRYHEDHVGRLLHKMGFSVQLPERRAAERDEERILRWRKKEWLRVKKRPRGATRISSS